MLASSHRSSGWQYQCARCDCRSCRQVSSLNVASFHCRRDHNSSNASGRRGAIADASSVWSPRSEFLLWPSVFRRRKARAYPRTRSRPARWMAASHGGPLPRWY
ncbi:hypothetical protein KCP75_13910 [Salmonella enterica subsp. enterica]|nr:hypothetical protein KCP75_13910 [Salmonella enterica subsp. enterica]